MYLLLSKIENLFLEYYPIGLTFNPRKANPYIYWQVF